MIERSHPRLTRRRFLGTAVAGAATAAPLAGAWAQAPAARKPTLRLGAAVALTGPVSSEGRQVKDGYEYWMKVVNARGGVDVAGTRHHVEFVFYDDESKAETGARLTEKLISDDKVRFILGPFSSGIAQATSTISERYRVLTINPQANADPIYQRGYKYIFSILPPASIYLGGLLDMATTLSPAPKRAAIMIRDDPFGVAAGEGAARYAQGKGFEIVFKEKYPANITDVSSILTTVKGANPDIFLASTLFQDSVLITRQAKDLRFAPKLMAFTAGPSLPDFVKALGPDAEFVCGADGWLPTLKFTGELLGSSADYATAIQKEKGYVPRSQCASGSMAALVLQLAIQKAGTLETEAVRKALLGLEPKTFWGPIGWNEQGKNVKGFWYPFQIQDGKVVPVWPKEGRAADPRYPMPAWTAR